MKHAPLFIAVATALSFSAFAADETKQSLPATGGAPAKNVQTEQLSGQQAASGGSKAKKSGGQRDAETVKQVQEKLAAEGHDVGQPDGKLGPKTQAALKKYQESKGLPASGQLDEKTLSELGVSKSAGTGSSAKSSEKSQSSAAGGSSAAADTASKSSSERSAEPQQSAPAAPAGQSSEKKY